MYVINYYWMFDTSCWYFQFLWRTQNEELRQIASNRISVASNSYQIKKTVAHITLLMTLSLFQAWATGGRGAKESEDWLSDHMISKYGRLRSPRPTIEIFSLTIHRILSTMTHSLYILIRFMKRECCTFWLILLVWRLIIHLYFWGRRSLWADPMPAWALCK